jgi:hypothetical protein
MCRHLAYLGAPATLRSVIIEPSHGLYRQAWAPRLQRPGLPVRDRERGRVRRRLVRPR